MSKFALEGLTKSMALDLGKYGIRVNTVSPTKTIVKQNEMNKQTKRLKIIKSKIPLNKFSTIEEIASIVYFLTTKEASSITGTSIISDGGWTAGKMSKLITDDKKFYDPNIDRKNKIYNEAFKVTKDGTPIPSIIEISNSGVCNRECSFCPRSDPGYKHVKEFFSNKLHDKLCDDLSSYNFSGIFAYCGFNEPLLKKDINRDITYARKKLPNSKIEIVTNGDVLNKERLQKLFDSGLSTILISVYDGKKEEDEFHELCESLNLKKSQYVIRNRYMPEELDFGLNN